MTREVDPNAVLRSILELVQRLEQAESDRDYFEKHAAELDDKLYQERTSHETALRTANDYSICYIRNIIRTPSEEITQIVFSQLKLDEDENKHLIQQVIKTTLAELNRRVTEWSVGLDAGESNE